MLFERFLGYAFVLFVCGVMVDGLLDKYYTHTAELVRLAKAQGYDCSRPPATPPPPKPTAPIVPMT